MAEKQEAPQAHEEQTQPGSLWEAQEALLQMTEPEGETLETEEAEPAEEEESQPVEEDESLEEESEESEDSEETDNRAEEGEDLYAVTINGEEHTIPLDELLKGYSRHSDYTRKTQELSEQRRQISAKHQQWSAEVQQIQTERQQYVTALQNVVENSAGALDQFATVDWESLKNDNPLEYITKRDEFRETQDNVRQAQFQQQQAHQAYQQESQRNHTRVLREEHGKLAVALPEWSEESSRKKLGTEIKEYALTQGYSQEEIKSLIDHRSLLVLHKAMKFDKASSPDVVQKKVKNKPNVIRTGSPKSKSGVSKSKRTAQMKRLQGSGRIDDASALLEDFIDL